MNMETLMERRWKCMKEKNLTSSKSKISPESLSISEVIFRSFDAFRKFWYISLILVVLGGLFGYLYYKKTYTPFYESKAIFSVKAANYDGNTKSTSFNNRALTEGLSVSFNYLINNEVFYEILKRDMGLNYVPATITISPVVDTNIMNIEATGADAELVYKTIKSVLNNYEAVTAFVVGDTRLTIIEEPSKPLEPANPYNPIVAIIIGAMVGLVFSMIPALFVGVFYKTIQTSDDISKYLSIYSFGTLPFLPPENKKAKERTDCSILNKDVGFRYLESMRSVSSRCDRIFKKEKTKVILVTSTQSGDGKSTLSMNLAYSLSKMQYKVMLIDGNLRKPSLKDMVHSNTPAFSFGDFLDGKIKSSQAIVNLKDTRVIAITPDQNTEHPVDVINSDNMKTFMEDVKDVVDYVIIDAPSCTGLSDAAALAQYCDGVVYVLKEAKVRVNKIINTLQEFSYTKKPILGCVLNGSYESSKNSYGYAKYSYGKYGYGIRRRGYGSGQYGMYGYGYGDSPRAKYGYGKYGKYGYGVLGKYGYGDRYGYGDERYGYGAEDAYGEYGKTSEKEFKSTEHKLTKHIKLSSTEEEKQNVENEKIKEEQLEEEQKKNPPTRKEIRKAEKELKKKLKESEKQTKDESDT